MNVLLINGSPRPNGCTFTALSEVASALGAEGVSAEIVSLGTGPLRDCTACRKCAELDNACIFSDDCVNDLIARAARADGFVFGTPVYYAHPSGRVLSFLDRAFYSGSAAFACKPAAAVASARRAGTTASIDALGKYFGISRMLTVGSTYWSMVHGNCPADVLQDREGLQTMRNLAREMAWLMRCIETARAAGICPPTPERTERTNFIR